MNCKICNEDSGQKKYCDNCSTHIGKLGKNVAKKELGRTSIHADIVKMLNEMNKQNLFSWFKKDAGAYSQNGVSDFSITFPVFMPESGHEIGVHIACEVKAGKNKLSALQAEYLKNHVLYGKGIGVVVRSADELKEVLTHLNRIIELWFSGNNYQDCHEILKRSWLEILSTLDKVETVKG